MVSINTNLSSMLVQMNLQQSTFDLNKAIERMTTGYKLNHASDNAANYSIAQNMVSKLSSYDVASDNISSGMDLVKTAQDTISLLQTHGERIQNLITQAQNGTYGEASLAAINSEVQARIDEINRIYANTEYNGINILDGINNQNGTQLPEWAESLQESLTPQYNGFIAEAHTIDDSVVNTMTHVSELSSFTSGETYAVSTADDLAKLAELVNAENDSTNVTFVMGSDIDLTSWCEANASTGGWDPIGDYSGQFKGTFNGNGHKITGLKIDRTNLVGLFGATTSGSVIKNVCLENVDINGRQDTGSLVGYAQGNVVNCYTTGSITGYKVVGGLVGKAYKARIDNSYASCTVSGTLQEVGGLVGESFAILNGCFATGSVNGETATGTGGLVGESVKDSSGLGLSSINSSYAACVVTGDAFTGGLVGVSEGGMFNCYATGSVTGNEYTGGLVGVGTGHVSKSYATGSVTGGDWTGGLAGVLQPPTGWGGQLINQVASLGTVSSSTGNQIGALIGGIINTYDGTSFGNITITNASALAQDLAMIGFEGNYSGTAYSSGQMEGWLSNITSISNPLDATPPITIQVGINGDNSSKITFECSISYDISALTTKGVQDKGAFDVINKFLNDLSSRATDLGAVYNRLESALDSTTVAMQNLTSSLSTIRDADVAKESSNYIKAQILQQASATLLATANQFPSIALQLL